MVQVGNLHTRSHHDRGVWAVLLVCGLLLIAAAGVFAWQYLQPSTIVRVGDGVFKARIVTSENDLKHGLSGTSKLEPNQAMLFDFSRDDRWSIWMKDMRYPIDILWIDNAKKVIYIVKNLAPDSYPDSYKPDKPARYVIELPAGTVDSKRIQIGQRAEFPEHGEKGII